MSWFSIQWDEDQGDLGDYETCSWCTTEVLDSSLKELPAPHGDGARLCPDCYRGAIEALDTNQPEKR